MRKEIWTTKTLVFAVTTVALVAACSTGFAKEIYAQLSSSKAQTPSAESKTAQFENVDANSGFQTNSDGVTIEDPGAYFIMVEGQAGLVTQSQSQAGGYVKLWIEKNHKLVSNSASEKYVGTEASAGTFVTQCVLPLSKGDIITVGFSSERPGAGLVISQGEPKATSLGFTIFKIAP